MPLARASRYKAPCCCNARETSARRDEAKRRAPTGTDTPIRVLSRRAGLTVAATGSGHASRYDKTNNAAHLHRALALLGQGLKKEAIDDLDYYIAV